MIRIRYHAICLFLVLFVLNNSDAQSLDHCLGEYVIKLKEGAKIHDLTKQLDSFRGIKTHCKIKEQLLPSENIWLISVDPNHINELDFLNEIFEKKEIEVVQLNKLISLRNVPNDPRFDEQWQFINNGINGEVVNADFDIDQAWDITTGGVTPFGDTIVVAVLDNGIDTDHEDFGDNLWVNKAEINNNGIDDDNNGYVDDYFGFNSENPAGGNIDEIGGGGHGTPVAGTIGAKGNNGIGVSGVNWDVKLMIIKNNFNTNEANVLKAYGYALNQRILYNETNGQQGAFVVATNASWGVDFGNPEDSPIWCSFYDDMGEAGIVSCGATINDNVNVDVEGDLPTGCTSDYLISVTNMASDNDKVTGAGYGVMSIDLGAYGAGTFTTADGNDYDNFGGTSGATPFVTGTIALLYAAPCANLTFLAKTNPSAAALFAKQYILDGVKPNSNLENITVTEGVLNINNSLTLLMDDCAECSIPRTLASKNSTDSQSELTWVAFNSALTVNLQWRELGTQNWNTTLNVEPPFTLTGLKACTSYEFNVEAICSGTTSGYSDSHTFKTKGCCEPPLGIEAIDIEETSSQIVWEAVLLSSGYDFRYREIGTMEWIEEFNLQANSFVLSNLTSCVEYEYQILTLCTAATTVWSEPLSFTTKGCGACFDKEYCEASGNNSSGEWIEAITINGITNNSGNNNGYENFEDVGITLSQTGLYRFSLVPGFDNLGPYPEYFTIWIDYNQNGAFENSEEVFNPGGATEESLDGLLTIPEDAILGFTKMRVIMKWTGNYNGDTPPTQCEDGFGFGEAEDYCVQIIEQVEGCPIGITSFTISTITEDAASLVWDEIEELDFYYIRYREVSNPEWNEEILFENTLALSNLKVCTEYEAEIKAICNGIGTVYSETLVFKTECDNAILQIPDVGELSIQPTLFKDQMSISGFDANQEAINVRIFNVQGFTVFENSYSKSGLNAEIKIDGLSSIQAGIYFVSLSSITKQYLGKAVKM